MRRRTTLTRSSAPRSLRGEDAVSMLEEDHKKVQKLFDDFEKAHRQDNQEMCHQIAQHVCDELDVHTALEEELFYPAAREALDEEDEELIDEAEAEHKAAKDLIEQLREMAAGDEELAPTFKLLAESIKHHVKEEEGELFPKVNAAKLDLDILADDMRSRKVELLSEVGRAEEEPAEDDGDEQQPLSRSGSRART